MPEKYQCPACKQFKELTHFSARPVDNRCDICLPPDQAMVAYDKKVQLAGNKWASMLSQAEKGTTLAPLERMLQAAYDEWGGTQSYVHDLVTWIKDLADCGKTNAAVAHMMAMLKLHAKVDHMRLEDNWKQMDDATLKSTLQLKMMALMAEMDKESAKGETIDALLEKAPAVTDY